MAKVIFTPNIQRLILCPDADAPGRTVREVLQNTFSQNSGTRSYVLDDHLSDAGSRASRIVAISRNPKPSWATGHDPQ
jgi:hypothetical protein